jgi:hypothetical protein
VFKAKASPRPPKARFSWPVIVRSGHTAPTNAPRV